MADEQNLKVDSELAKKTSEFFDRTIERVAADQAADRAWREEHRAGFEAAARAGQWAPDWVRGPMEERERIAAQERSVQDLKPAAQLSTPEIMTQAREVNEQFQQLSERYDQAPATQKAEIRQEMVPVVERERELRSEYNGRLQQENSRQQAAGFSI